MISDSTITVLGDLAHMLPEGDIKGELGGAMKKIKDGDAPERVSDRLFDWLMELSSQKSFAMLAEIRYYGDGGSVVGNSKYKRIRKAENEGIHKMLRAGIGLTPSQADKFIDAFLLLAGQAEQTDRRFKSTQRESGLLEMSFQTEGILDARGAYARTIVDRAGIFSKDQCERIFPRLYDSERRGFMNNWIENALPAKDLMSFFWKELDAMQGAGSDARLDALRQRLGDIAKRPARKETLVKVPAFGIRQTN